MWWNLHNGIAFASVVLLPLKASMWCISVMIAGLGQSGQAHPFHWAAIAIRCLGLWSRWVWPASMAVVPEKMTGRVPEVQMYRSAVSVLISPVWPSM